MQMNRRTFMKSTAVAGVSAPLMASMIGCPASTLETDLNSVLQAATNVLIAIDPTASWLPSFQAAVTGLKSAELTWQTGGVVTVVEDALNTLASVAALVPLSAPYSPLISVLVAGIDMVLGLIPGTVPPSVVAMAHGVARVNIYRTTAKVTIPHHFGDSKAADFKKAWNTAAKSNLRLASAVLK